MTSKGFENYPDCISLRASLHGTPQPNAAMCSSLRAGGKTQPEKGEVTNEKNAHKGSNGGLDNCGVRAFVWPQRFGAVFSGESVQPCRRFAARSQGPESLRRQD